jgi:hypothetical protein
LTALAFICVQDSHLLSKNQEPKNQEPKKEGKRKPMIKEKIQKIKKSQKLLNYRSP